MTLTGSREAGSNEWTNSMPQVTEPTFPRGSKYPFTTALGFLFVGFSAVPFASSVRIVLALIGLTQFLLGMIGWVFLDKPERYPSGPDQPWSEDGGLYPGPIGPRDGEPRPPHARLGPIRWRALDEGYRGSRSRPGSGIRRPYRRMGHPISPSLPSPNHVAHPPAESAKPRDIRLQGASGAEPLAGQTTGGSDHGVMLAMMKAPVL
jgi:hypothetical protein